MTMYTYDIDSKGGRNFSFDVESERQIEALTKDLEGPGAGWFFCIIHSMRSTLSSRSYELGSTFAIRRDEILSFRIHYKERYDKIIQDHLLKAGK